jgi:hypothetical protein
VITHFEGVTTRLNYGIPFFYGRKWICYLNVVKKDGGVELVFLQALHFRDPHGLLQARGRKMVKGILIRSVEEAPGQALLDTIRAAVDYDRRFED